MNLPQNRSDERLQAALHSLAQGSQTGALGETGDALLGAFRRHHARRRARRRAVAVAALLAFSLPAAWLLRLNHRPETNSQGSHMAKLPSQPVPVTVPQVAGTPVPLTNRAVARRAPNKTPAPLEFVALPAYAGSSATDNARIIRLELSGRALRMVGAPVNPEDEGRQVQADFVVGQDGTPYAVRLVH